MPMMMIIFYDNDFANANAMKMKMKKIRMIMIKHLRWKDFSSTIIASSSKNKQLNQEKQKKKKWTRKLATDIPLLLEKTRPSHERV